MVGHEIIIFATLKFLAVMPRVFVLLENLQDITQLPLEINGLSRATHHMQTRNS